MPAAADPRIDESLVRRLVDSQFPQWLELPLAAVEPLGWALWKRLISD